MIILLAFLTFVSTLTGGLLAMRHQDKLHRFLGFAAGVVIGVVAFELLPEILQTATESSLQWSMVALLVGFLLFHTLEKSILIHHSNEAEYEVHHHPQVGWVSAAALVGHSMLDGFGIGLGFQAGTTVGLAVAIAVIAHDFSDGLNTVNLMLLHKNSRRKAFGMLLLDAIAPIVGAVIGMKLHVSASVLSLYLGFFAGFLLYIGASEILPEAHSKHSSYLTIVLTILGAAFIFAISRFA